MNKPTFGMLVFRGIISLADILSWKFYNLSSKLRLSAKNLISDNRSAADMNSRHTSRLKTFTIHSVSCSINTTVVLSKAYGMLRICITTDIYT